MKTISLTVAFIFLFLVAYSQENNIKNIKWLLGAWQMKIAEQGRIIEHWQYVNDSTLQGNSFLVKPNNDSILQESVQLVYRNKTMFYIPTVNGQNENKSVTFKQSSCKNKRLIFENCTHDFPQKIVYQLQSKNKLLARIEGTKKGEFKKKNYQMDRL